MKRTIKNKKVIIIAVLVVLLVAVAILAFPASRWLTQTYERKKTEQTVTAQIKPLKEVLTTLGFADLTNLNTVCSNAAHTTGMHYVCSSSIDRYTKVPTDTDGASKFNKNVENLSQILKANDWQSRTDYSTIPWFQKISEGVDYQPDQLNTKTVGNFDCILDFFTAYSKTNNQEPAISMILSCVKHSDVEPSMSL